MHQLIEALQRESGGGCAKAINVTVFVDSQGNYIGRSELRTTKLFPRSIEQLISGNEDGLAAALYGAK